MKFLPAEPAINSSMATRAKYTARDRIPVHIAGRTIVPHRDKSPVFGNHDLNERSAIEVPGAGIHEHGVGESNSEKESNPCWRQSI